MLGALNTYTDWWVQLVTAIPPAWVVLLGILFFLLAVQALFSPGASSASSATASSGSWRAMFGLGGPAPAATAAMWPAPAASARSGGLGLLQTLLGWLVLLALLYVAWLNRDTLNSFAAQWSGDVKRVKKPSAPESTTAPGPAPPTAPKEPEKQVFNISENAFTYQEAKAVCKAYGAELATYQQVEDAYKAGGEWCNYGWSADQMALYPTQPETYNELRARGSKYRNNCGRPGVNGGYMPDKDLKFGVNCYGVKPERTSMNALTPEENHRYPTTEEDRAFQKEVDTMRAKLQTTLLSPFNYDRWSQ